MDHAHYSPTMMPLLLQSNILESDFFTVIDVGCSGGIDPLWRLFGDRLRAAGADPQRGECRRLQDAESNRNVRYVPCLIGLPPEHDFHVRAQTQSEVARGYFRRNGQRYSSAYARQLQPKVATQSQSLRDNLTSERMSIAQLARHVGFDDVDFIKIDTDGVDLEALLSSEELIRSHGVLGYMIEAPFTGTDHETSNSFHNIDRFMKSQGFALYHLTMQRYSRKDLPAQFVFPILAQTEYGQIVWGDALYLRDGSSPRYRDFWGEELSLPKLAKLACLYELLRLPDCAAELINIHRDRFASVVYPNGLLDALVPPLHQERHSYSEYMRRFREDVRQFFPREKPQKKTLSALVARGLRKLLQKLRG